MVFLKTFVIGLLASALLVAVSASAAFAVEFHSESKTTFWLGQQATQMVFTTTAGTVKCKEWELTAETSAAAEPEITVKEAPKKCSAFGQATIVHMNGCDYDLRPLTGPPIHGPMKITCPPGKKIEWTIVTAECSLAIGEQEPSGVIDYSNEGAGSSRDLLLTYTLKEISYTVQGPGTVCGSAGAHTDGALSGTVTLKGYKNEAHTEQTGVWVE